MVLLVKFAGVAWLVAVLVIAITFIIEGMEKR